MLTRNDYIKAATARQSEINKMDKKIEEMENQLAEMVAAERAASAAHTKKNDADWNDAWADLTEKQAVKING